MNIAALVQNPYLISLYTIAMGALGAFLGELINLPVAILLGPALFLSVLGVAGMRFEITPLIRNAAFVIIGIAIGSGVNEEARHAFMTWPAAFMILAASLAVTLYACRFLLERYFGFDSRSAVLAASPGHLSFVVSLGADIKADLTRVGVVQSVRLLSLTLLVPFLALFFGFETAGAVLPVNETMTLAHGVGLLAASVIGGFVLRLLRAPAPFLLSGMILSTLGHFTDVTPGGFPSDITMICFMIAGCLIGARFSGISVQALRSSLGAGLASTAIAGLATLIAAIPAAMLVDMPLTHVLTAFSPGGLETMTAIGVVLGANGGFVAACHVGRLLILSLLVPVVLQQVTPQAGASSGSRCGK